VTVSLLELANKRFGVLGGVTDIVEERSASSPPRERCVSSQE
jgi:hypothetical protein